MVDFFKFNDKNEKKSERACLKLEAIEYLTYGEKLIAIVKILFLEIKIV